MPALDPGVQQQPLQPKAPPLGIQGVEQSEKQAEAGLEQAAGEAKTAETQYQDQYKINAPKIQELPPAPKASDPVEVWGSFAMMASAIGGLFTRQHLTTAIKAATGTLEGFRQKDMEAAQANFERWKISHDNAMQMLELAKDQLDASLKIADTDKDLALAKYKAVGDAFGMKLDYIRTIDDAKLHQAEIGRIGAEMEVLKPKIIMGNLQAQAAINLFQSKGFQDLLKSNPQRAAEMMYEIQKPTMFGIDDTNAGDRQADAAQAATGMPLNQIYPGYGQLASFKRQQIRADALQYIMQTEHVDPAGAGEILAERSIEFQGGKRSVGQLMTMRGATIAALQQIKFHIDMAKKDMGKLGSSNASPIINAIARGEEAWTGNPAYADLFQQMQATAAEIARVRSGGQASTAQLHQGSMDEAQKWLNADWTTPAMFDAISDSMEQEIPNRIENFDLAITAQERSLSGGHAPTTTGGHKYSVGQEITRGKKRYKITGGDLDNDPDVQEIMQ